MIINNNSNIVKSILKIFFFVLLAIGILFCIFAYISTIPGPISHSARVISRMIQIRSAADTILYERNNYLGLSCSDEKIKSACESIIKYAGRYPTFNINEKGNAYCSYILLPEKRNGKDNYWCIDSTGMAVEIKENPPSTCSVSSFLCE